VHGHISSVNPYGPTVTGNLTYQQVYDNTLMQLDSGITAHRDTHEVIAATSAHSQ